MYGYEPPKVVNKAIKMLNAKIQLKHFYTALEPIPKSTYSWYSSASFVNGKVSVG